MKKLIGFLMILGLVIAGSGLAQALSFETTPILGTSTSWDGDVHVVTNSGVVDIPGGGINNPWSMNLFYVGQTVDAGSGIYYGLENNLYQWSVVYTGPSRTVSYGDNYPGDSGEGFVMNYLDPVSTLTLADVGTWNYTETWANVTPGSNENDLNYSTTFNVVGVPEPGTLILLGSGLLGLAIAGGRKFRK